MLKLILMSAFNLWKSINTIQKIFLEEWLHKLVHWVVLQKSKDIDRLFTQCMMLLKLSIICFRMRICCLQIDTMSWLQLSSNSRSTRSKLKKLLDTMSWNMPTSILFIWRMSNLDKWKWLVTNSLSKEEWVNSETQFFITHMMVIMQIDYLTKIKVQDK